jgi:hypothetical protein
MNYKDICLEKYGYYEMANSDICDSVLEGIKKTYPEATIIKAGIHQYIVVSEMGRKILNTKLENELQKYKEDITRLEYTIYELGLLDFES